MASDGRESYIIGTPRISWTRVSPRTVNHRLPGDGWPLCPDAYKYECRIEYSPPRHRVCFAVPLPNRLLLHVFLAMKSSSKCSCYLLPLLLVSSVTSLLWPALGPNFWKNNQPSFTKICLYSNDPSQFVPMCIMCPNTLYPIVLTTCVMGAAIPLNVTYTQANCIVGNCAVNLSPPGKGRRSADDRQGRSLSDLSLDTSEENIGSVPYTMVVDGRNVTVTSVEEYFVHSDLPDITEDYVEMDL